MSRYLRLVCVSFLCFAAFFCISQVPDWSFFRDGDGNTYFIDNIGKIRTTVQAESFRKTLSVKGLDYYVAQAKELIDKQHPVEGLLILKTILAMPVIDQRVVDAREHASVSLNSFKARHGTRFDYMNRLASPVLFSSNDITHVVHDIMFFSFTSRHNVYILKNRWRVNLHYSYNGLSIGVKKNLDSNEQRETAYDFLIAIDSEKFGVKIKNLRQLEDNWTKRLYFENIKREEITRSENKVLYSFKGGRREEKDLAFSGFEVLVKNRQFGYYVRIITPSEKLESTKAAMMEIADSFSISDLN